MPEPADLDKHRQHKEAQQQLQQATRGLLENLAAMSQAQQILNKEEAPE